MLIVGNSYLGARVNRDSLQPEISRHTAYSANTCQSRTSYLDCTSELRRLFAEVLVQHALEYALHARPDLRLLPVCEPFAHILSWNAISLKVRLKAAGQHDDSDYFLQFQQLWATLERFTTGFLRKPCPRYRNLASFFSGQETCRFPP